MSGDDLLEDWKCKTREERLERAVIALMSELNNLHIDYQGESLRENLDNPNVYCSCSDAYRMGHEALLKPLEM